MWRTVKHKKERIMYLQFLLSVLILTFLNNFLVECKVEPGQIYKFRTVVDGQCLTANSHDYRSGAGIFLGQVSTEDCDKTNKAQKWGVILWSKKKPYNELWLYPRENGLNAITAIPDPEEPLPEKNLVEIIPMENSEEKFLIRSLELNQCVLTTGKTNAITYEPCNMKIKEQLWTVNSTHEDQVDKSISDRSVFATVKDFIMYHGHVLIAKVRGDPIEQ